MASLFGVFLYLGVMNLVGVELVKRTALFFVPVKYHWVTSYTKTVGSLLLSPPYVSHHLTRREMNMCKVLLE